MPQFLTHRKDEMINVCCSKLLSFGVNDTPENMQACCRWKYMCTFVLTFPMGGFSKYNVKKRKYRDWKFDYKNTSKIKFVKKNANI